jgi:hypothetical protein
MSVGKGVCLYRARSLSLNGMMPFGVKLKNKTVHSWPKMNNIIPLRVCCYMARIMNYNESLVLIIVETFASRNFHKMNSS